MVAGGFTPTTFSNLTAGSSIAIIIVDDYGSCTFSHWSQGGSSANDVSFIVPIGAIAYTAVYDCGTSTSSTVGSSTVNGGGAP